MLYHRISCCRLQLTFRGPYVHILYKMFVCSSYHSEVNLSLTSEVNLSLISEVNLSLTSEVKLSLTSEVNLSLTSEVNLSLTSEVNLSLTSEVNMSLTPEVKIPLPNGTLLLRVHSAAEWTVVRCCEVFRIGKGTEHPENKSNKSCFKELKLLGFLCERGQKYALLDTVKCVVVRQNL